ncbi:hypothetical protein V3C99_012341, partial [Haemonchus contortus]
MTSIVKRNRSGRPTRFSRPSFEKRRKRRSRSLQRPDPWFGGRVFRQGSRADSPFASEGRHGPAPLKLTFLPSKVVRTVHLEDSSRRAAPETCASAVAGSAILPMSAALQERGEDRRRQWKAVISAIAEKEKLGTALLYRFPLSKDERSEIKENPKRRRAKEVASLASEMGLSSIASLIRSCFDSAVAKGTLKAYEKIRDEFLGFVERSSVPASGIHKLRNLYLASLIDKGKTKSLELHAAALNHFLGPLPVMDQDIQRALL